MLIRIPRSSSRAPRAFFCGFFWASFAPRPSDAPFFLSNHCERKVTDSGSKLNFRKQHLRRVSGDIFSRNRNSCAD